MSDRKDVYLCVIEEEAGNYSVKAVYDSEREAEAWVEGVKAAYGGRAWGFLVYADEGAIDIAKMVQEATDE